MSHRLQILIPDELALRIRKAAERSRVSGGEWVRRAITRSLAEERVASDPLSELSALDAPTGDMEQMLAEIEAGRG
jgi:hypothetical protein